MKGLRGKLLLEFNAKGLVTTKQYNFAAMAAAGTLTSDITFTRASSGSYYNSSGLLSIAGNNAPRFDHNPSTLALKGFLIEQASTNLIKQSNAFSTTPWTTTAALTASAATGPDGIAGSAFALLASAQFQNVVQNVTVASSTQYTLSGWIRSASGSYTVTLQASDGTNFYNVAAVATTTWQRFSVTFTTASSTNLTCVFQDNGTSAWQTFYIYGMQLEQTAFITSYIPTTTTSVTRAGDLAIAGSIPWFNFAAGTILANFITEGLAASGSYPGVFSVNDGTTNNEIYANANFNAQNSGVAYEVIGGVGVGGTNGSSVAGALSKLGVSYSSGSFLWSLNGATPSLFSTAAPSGLTQLNFGSRGYNVGQASGWLQSLTYYNFALSSAQLKAIT